MPLAVPPLLGETADPVTGQQMRGVFKQDLELTGFFRILEPSSAPETVETLRYPAWAALGALGVIAGRMTNGGAEAQLALQLVLHDVQEQRARQQKDFAGPTTRHREMAHRFSDIVYREFTGEAGPFDTQIMCVIVGKTQGSKDIVLMDYDGYGAQVLVADGALNLAPVLSPNGTTLAYTSYRAGSPNIYLRNLLTGAEERITPGPGLALPGSWSPDGLSLALSQTVDGNSDLYLYDTRTKRMTRLTHDWGIDVSPSFAPDGKRLAFVSDRAGSPQVYVTDTQGSPAVRLTFEGHYNTAPSWSPREDTIAFVGRADEDQTLGIYTIHPTGTGQRRLGGGGNPEGPAWAPHGRFVMYTNTDGGAWSRYMMREDGLYRQIPARGPGCLVSQWVARTAR